MRITTRGAIERILADPAYRVAPVPSGESGLAWLRATASRFANGEQHARRRALVADELAALHPPALRDDARERTEARLSGVDGEFDLMAVVARPVPLATLAAALGVPEPHVDSAVAAAALVGPAYLAGEGDPRVDRAVERLRALLERATEEATAAAIAVLAQACEATASLISNAVLLAADRRRPVDEALRHALLRASPIRVMKRVSPAGDDVLLDLDAAVLDASADARPLAFGSGLRPCPGEAQARAIAAGVLEPVLRRCTVSGPPPERVHAVAR